MAAYIVVNVEITNPEQYKSYLREVEASVRAYGGRYLIRGGPTEILEGDFTPRRFVVLEFADATTARAWWSSDEYAPAKRIRQASARTDMFLAEGYDTPAATR